MTPAQRKLYVQWDVLSWSKALNYWDKQIDWNSVNDCLELGSNKGGLSLWLAQKGKQVMCTDYQDVVRIASPLHKEYPEVKNLISYEDLDATQIPYENQFDVIVFKSILGGIGRDGRKDKQEKTLKEIHKALKPGGTLLFAENLVASPLHKFFRKKFVRWGDSWRYVTINEMEEFLSPFKSYTLKSNGVLGLFGRNEFQRNLLARYDQLYHNWLVPRSWRYIVYGIAVK